MASSLPASKLVNITLSLKASAVSSPAFGIPLIYDTQNVLSGGTLGKVNTYSSLAEMVSDGYAPYNSAYKMADFLLKQQPRVPAFKVGCVTHVSVTADLAALNLIDPVWYGFLLTSRATQDIEDAAAWALASDGVKFLWAAQSSPLVLGAALYSAGGNTQVALWNLDALTQVQTITISADFAADASVTMHVNGETVGSVPYNTSNAQTLTDLATALQATTAIATATTSGAHTIICTAASALNDLVFGAYTGGGATPTTAAFAVTQASSPPIDAAAAGRIIPLGAGEATMAEKNLFGCTPSNLTTSQATALEAQRINYYANIAGIGMTYPGTCSADIATNVPLFADLVFGAAAFKSDLLTAWVAYLMASKKVPNNDSGIAGAVAVLATIGKKYVAKNYLEPFNQKDAITFPLAAAQDPGDRSLRILNGISANFVATGAIQTLGNVNISIQA